jgi:hypothetical protein
MLTGGWKNVLLGGRRVNSADSFHKYGPMWKWKGWHTGEDFSASTGTPINAPVGGKVISITTSGPYGRSVLLQLDDGKYMRFAHMSAVNVSMGQRLKPGTYVGAVGATGNVTGPHLHLEVMTSRGDGFIDPVAYLNGKKTQATASPGTPTQRTVRDETGGTASSVTSPTGTTSVTYNDGGWTKMAKSGFSKKDFYASLSSMFGSIDILLALDREARAELGGKSIQQAIDEMVKQKIVDPSRARTLLQETAWFKKYGEETTARLIAERQRPGEFAELAKNSEAGINAMLQEAGVSLAPDVVASLARNAYVYNWSPARLDQEVKKAGSGADVTGLSAGISAKLNEMGVQLSAPAMERLARSSWLYGWSDATLIDEIQNLGDADVSFSGGAIARGIEDITTFANDYGVKLSDADVRQYRNDFLDNLGDQRIKETLQERAAQTYSVFADQIRAGQSTRALASAYFGTAADLLETDPDSIDWSDPLFAGGKAFTTIDPNTGKQVQKGLWEFEKDVRKDTRWLDTKNAKESMLNTTANIMKTMGFM